MVKKIVLEDLEVDSFSIKDFPEGAKVRIYLNYHGGSFGRIYVKEGVVLDSRGRKTFLDIPDTTCLQLRVKRAGQVIDGKSKLEKVAYTQKYLYYNIGMVERL